MKISALLSSVLIFAPAAAYAQGSADGRGFPIGEKSRIHTNLDVGVSYDSNPLRSTADQSEWKALIRPSLEIDVPSDTLKFGLQSQLMIEQFFGTNAALGPANDDTLIGGHVGVNLRAGTGKSVVGFELKDTLTRTPNFINTVGAVGLDEVAFPQWYNRGIANVVLRPGGGALEFRLGYGNELTLFDDLPQGQKHSINFESKWKFFPKTAAVFNADMGFFSASTVPGAAATNNASPYNITVGLQGQITPKLSTMLRIGFGDTLSWQGDFFSTVSTSNVRTLIAGAMFSYTFLKDSSFTLGFERTVKPVVLLNSYVSNSPYAKFTFSLDERLMLSLYGAIDFRDYSGDAADAQTRMALIDVRVEYWFFSFLKGGIAYQMINQEATSTGGGALLSDYTRHQGLLTVGAYY